jgi:hypothetical protein
MSIRDHFSINKLGVIYIGLGKLGLLWVPPWCWEGLIWEWCYGYEPDDCSWYVRILGWEINWMK